MQIKHFWVFGLLNYIDKKEKKIKFVFEIEIIISLSLEECSRILFLKKKKTLFLLYFYVPRINAYPGG